jgi:CheY-like chemotaxis protein
MRKRVETLGGVCGVSGRRDGSPGALFYFTIPYKPDMSAKTHPKPCTRSLDIAPTKSSKKCNIELTPMHATIHATDDMMGVRILVVDDSFLIQKTMTRALKAAGSVCAVASNGLDCLNFLSKSPYDLVLLDINMPIMDGIECITKLRALEDMSSCERHYGQHQIVIGLSANSDSESREAALTAGMDAYATKPLSMPHLKELYNQLLSPV